MVESRSDMQEYKNNQGGCDETMQQARSELETVCWQRCARGAEDLHQFGDVTIFFQDGAHAGIVRDFHMQQPYPSSYFCKPYCAISASSLTGRTRATAYKAKPIP